MVKRKGFVMVMLIIGLMVVLAACGGTNYEPQAINEETDRCEICNMAIGDNQFATQIITKEGQSLKFDDIGDMYKWMTNNGAENIGAAFVRDYHSMNWIRMEDAYYVYDPSIRTPMAYGVLSFEKEEDAIAFIDKLGTGTLIQADSLSDHTWEVNRDMMDGHDHEDHSHGHDEEHSPHATD